MSKTTIAWPLLAMLLLIPLALAAQNMPGGSAFSVTRDSGDGIQISFQLPDWELETVQRGSETLSRVRIPGIPNLFIEEEETLPVFSTMVAIPYSGGVSLRMSESASNSRSGIRLDFTSALAAEETSGRHSGPLYPAAPALISEPMLLRDFRVVTLNVHPFQYDRTTGELTVRETINILLDFDNSPSVNEMEPPQSYSPAFAKIYPGIILNYDQMLVRNLDFTHPRLLVIYGNYSDTDYLGKVNEYVVWKRQKGYIVNAVSTATAGTTTTAIKAYIQAQYNNLATRPDYIVLIGDDSGTIAVPTYSTYMDYYYTWLAGGDNLGDVAIGRISVGTSEQMRNYMAKINSLEKDINLDLSSWLNRMVLVGDSASSGISTIYTNEYIYDTSITVNPDYTYTKLYGGSPSSTTINAAINQGVAFYNYRGYLGMSGWPSTMNSMNNIYRLFHAVFITCSTGSWGGGTSTTEQVVRYGTEATMGGAVTAIGMATSSTHTPMNNCLDVGIFHGIYPLGMRNMSEAMLYGKLYLYAVYGTSYPSQAYNFSGYCNLIGDPTAAVYVGIPEAFSVTAPASIPAGTASLEVTVKDSGDQPVVGASVVLSNSAGQQALAFTNETGQALLEFSPSLTGVLTITASKDDFKPLIQTLNIASGGGLVFDGYDISDDEGNGDGVANPGEIMDLYFALRNTSSATITPQGTITCSDPYVTLINDSVSFPSIAPGSSELSSALGLRIEDQCPDQHRFVLGFVFAGTHISVPVTVSSGRLEILSYSFVGSAGNLLRPGDTWPLTFTLRNGGSAPLTGIMGTLSSFDTFVEVTDTGGQWGNIPIGASSTNSSNTFTVSARSTCVNGMVIPLQLQLYSTAGFLQTIPLSFTIGQTTVTDPLGQDAYGYFIFGMEDTGYDQRPTYNWIGIAPAEGGNGTALNLYDPGVSHDEGDQVGATSIQTVNLPFPFSFYGVEYTQVSISSNGFIAFGATTDSDWRNWRLPNAGGPSPMLAVFWDDIQLGAGSGVYYWYNSAQHYYVVQWQNVISGYDQTTPQTFQAILYDPAYYPTHTGDGQIKLQYKLFNNIDLGSGDTLPHGNYCTIGIEDHTETIGLEYTYGNVWPTAAAPLHNESALFITTRPLVPDYPYLVLEQVAVLDPNSNDHLEPGESAHLSIRLGNRGLVDATGVSAILSSADPYVTITTSSATYGTVPAQTSAWPQSNFAVSVATNCPAGRQLNFSLAITSATGNWSYNFQLTVVVPALGFSDMMISDAGGNQNGIFDPGETVSLTIRLYNTGVIPSPAGTATLSCATPGITILNATDSFPILAAGAYEVLNFQLSAASGMAQGTLLTLVFNALAGSTTATHSEYLEVGAPLEVVIGTGTQTQSYPLDRYYNYSAHEAIYLASEIQMAGTLKSLSFYKASGTDVNPIEAVSIYLKHTAATTLATGNYSTAGYTLVYSGSYPNNGASGWMEVDLAPMFVYDGASNLSVLTVKGHQQWISGYPQWRYSGTSVTRARQNRSDTAAPTNLTAVANRPNLRLKVFPQIDLLLPPTNLSAIASHGYVLLTWTAPASGAADSYRIYRNGSLLTSVATLSHRDTAVTDGTTYQYYLTAVYDGIESPATGTVSATPNTHPPTDLAALAGNTTVALSWTAAEGRADGFAASGSRDRDISGYRIYRNGTPLTTTAATSYQDTGLSNGVPYSYYVTTLYSDPAGESGPSNTADATPDNIQTVIIGTGTSITTGAQNSPLNICNNSVHGQSVYTAAELNAAGIFGPIEIIALGFNVISAPNQPLPDFVIRLKHTTAENADAWHDATGLITCYANPSLLPVAGGYDLLSFQTPFLWNGTDNLLVDTAFGMLPSASQSGTLQFASLAGGYRFAWSNTADQTNVFSGGTMVGRRYNIQLAARELAAELETPQSSLSLSGPNPLITWAPVPTATSYRVDWADDPQGNFAPLATVSGTTSYTDTRVGIVRAFYRVTALR